MLKRFFVASVLLAVVLAVLLPTRVLAQANELTFTPVGPGTCGSTSVMMCYTATFSDILPDLCGWESAEAQLTSSFGGNSGPSCTPQGSMRMMIYNAEPKPFCTFCMLYNFTPGVPTVISASALVNYDRISARTGNCISSAGVAFAPAIQATYTAPSLTTPALGTSWGKLKVMYR
jgi:hypothetical protein